MSKLKGIQLVQGIALWGKSQHIWGQKFCECGSVLCKCKDYKQEESYGVFQYTVPSLWATDPALIFWADTLFTRVLSCYWTQEDSQGASHMVGRGVGVALEYWECPQILEWVSPSSFVQASAGVLNNIPGTAGKKQVSPAAFPQWVRYSFTTLLFLCRRCWCWLVQLCVVLPYKRGSAGKTTLTLSKAYKLIFIFPMESWILHWDR